MSNVQLLLQQKIFNITSYKYLLNHRSVLYLLIKHHYITKHKLKTLSNWASRTSQGPYTVTVLFIKHLYIMTKHLSWWCWELCMRDFWRFYLNGNCFRLNPDCSVLHGKRSKKSALPTKAGGDDGHCNTEKHETICYWTTKPIRLSCWGIGVVLVLQQITLHTID